MNNEEASPRPWTLDVGLGQILSAEGEIVCDSERYESCLPTREIDMSLIVTAVNAHDSLVEAMKDILDAAGDLDCGSALPFALIDAIKDARKAFPALAQPSGNPGQVKGASNAG